MDFITELKKDSIEAYNLGNIAGTDTTLEHGSYLKIEWEAEVDARTWGVKCIDIFVHKVTGRIEWEALEEDENEDIITGGFDFSSEGWVIKSELKPSDYGCIRPEAIVLDFARKEINIL
jgi:hypothetical protein